MLIAVVTLANNPHENVSTLTKISEHFSLFYVMASLRLKIFKDDSNVFLFCQGTHQTNIHSLMFATKISGKLLFFWEFSPFKIL